MKDNDHQNTWENIDSKRSYQLDEDEIDFYSKRMGISQERVKNALSAIGDSREKLLTYLNRIK